MYIVKIRYTLAPQLTSLRDSGVQLVDDVILSWSPMFAFSTRQNYMFSPFIVKACLWVLKRNKAPSPACILLNFHGKP